MILYITLKELCAFFRQKKEVFLFMVFCMISISFVMNYAFSFNRYRVNELKRDIEPFNSVYWITPDNEIPCSEIEKIKSELKANGFPEIIETYLLSKTSEGEEIVGADYIAKDSIALNEFWLESTDDILTGSGGNFCVVNEDYFGFGIHKEEYKGHIKVVGEKLMIDNEEFEVKGVVKGLTLKAFLIDLTKFKEKYPFCCKATFVFSEALNSTQEEEFYGIVRKHIEHGNVQPLDWFDGSVSLLYNTNILQYTAVIILSIICLVSMLEFWQNCNRTTYAIYWLNGASKNALVASSILGILMIALGGYLIGLCLSVATQFVFPMLAKLAFDDIILGFSLYMLCFIISGAIISIKEMRSIGINDIRRDI